MIYLILIYFLFVVTLLVFKKKNLSLLWLVLIPLGFCVSLVGLILFTEHISFANFQKNPLFSNSGVLIWKYNFSKHLSFNIFETYRMINVGIFLFLLGVTGFPLSQIYDTKKSLKKIALFSVPNLFILFNDPEKLLVLFEPHFAFWRFQNVLSFVQTCNNVLSLYLKLSVSASVVLFWVVHKKTPKIFKKKFKLLIAGIFPIHILVLVLFYWYPSHAIHFWDLSTIKSISMLYTKNYVLLTFVLSVLSIIVLCHITFVYNSVELDLKRRKKHFKVSMNTAESGSRVFAHSLKNHFLTIRLLMESEQQQNPGNENFSRVISICNKATDQIGSLPVSPQKLSLNNEIVGTKEIVDTICNKEYFVTIDPDILKNAYVNVDKNYFIEVIENLIYNSKDATKKIENPKIVFSIKKELNFIVFSVTDNGCGIPLEIQKFIFDPFFSTKPSISNWGMGLSFSRQIVELLGGGIEVQSLQNQFTIFRIYIPESCYGRN